MPYYIVTQVLFHVIARPKLSLLCDSVFLESGALPRWASLLLKSLHFHAKSLVYIMVSGLHLNFHSQF